MTWINPGAHEASPFENCSRSSTPSGHFWVPCASLPSNFLISAMLLSKVVGLQVGCPSPPCCSRTVVNRNCRTISCVSGHTKKLA